MRNLLFNRLSKNNYIWLRSIFYRLINTKSVFLSAVKHGFHPVLKLGDVEICFNSEESSFLHYIPGHTRKGAGVDFKRMRNMCRKMSGYFAKLRPDILIDVGANYGIFTILLNSFYLDNVPIICVEPDSRVFSYLEKNLTMAGLTEYKAIHAMAGALSENRLFRENFYGSLDSRADNIGQLEEYDEKSIPCYCLDELVDLYYPDKNNKSSLLIKIDVQGMDIEVLRGASKLLKSSSAAIVVIELQPDTMPDCNAELVYNLTQELGFKQIINLGESNVDWKHIKFPDEINTYNSFSKLWSILSNTPDAYTNLALLKGIT